MSDVDSGAGKQADRAPADGTPADGTAAEETPPEQTPEDRTPSGEDVYLARAEADDTALAVGFTLATGADAVVGRDGFGVPVVDVDRAGWRAAALHARDTLGMDFMDWLSAVDQPDADPAGVDVVLHVVASASVGPAAGRFGASRIMLRTRVPNADPVLPSITSVWRGAAWHERETFEMFGVTFSEFADAGGGALRPLLLPDGFEGTPLRKSFVLVARAVKPWPGAKDPGESQARSPGRRKTLPPGVPDPSWGPREPAGAEPAAVESPEAQGAAARPAGAKTAGAKPAGAEPPGSAGS